MGTKRALYTKKLLDLIDNHPADAGPDEGIFHDRMIKKFEAEGKLSDKELAKLERILDRLDAEFDPDDEDFDL